MPRESVSHKHALNRVCTMCNKVQKIQKGGFILDYDHFHPLLAKIQKVSKYVKETHTTHSPELLKKLKEFRELLNKCNVKPRIHLLDLSRRRNQKNK